MKVRILIACLFLVLIGLGLAEVVLGADNAVPLPAVEDAPQLEMAQDRSAISPSEELLEGSAEHATLHSVQAEISQQDIEAGTERTAMDAPESSSPDILPLVMETEEKAVDSAYLLEMSLENNDSEPMATLSPATLAVNSPAEREPSLLRLAVVGVKNETREKEFSNLLIAQGVSQLVAQALFDTGRYVPVEDNPEITGRINELVTLAASSGNDGFDSSGFDRRALGCDAVATAIIKKFSKSRTRSFMGPFSSANVDIEIEVEVAVREGDKPKITAAGSGTGTTKSKGFLFEVRKDKVHFDQTSVGQATQTAVQQAVSRLLTKNEEDG